MISPGCGTPGRACFQPDYKSQGIDGGDGLKRGCTGRAASVSKCRPGFPGCSGSERRLWAMLQALDFCRDLQRCVLSGENGGRRYQCCLSAQCVEILDGQHVLIKNDTKLPSRLVCDRFEILQLRGPSNLSLQAGDGTVGDAAGIDEREVSQVCGDVKSKPMRGDAARHVNADGTDFSFRPAFRIVECFGLRTARLDAAPHAGQARDASRAHAEPGAEPDQGLFHVTHEVAWPP